DHLFDRRDGWALDEQVRPGLAGIAAAAHAGIEIDQQAFEVQARDCLQALEVTEVGTVDHFEERALAVEESQDAIVVVGDLAKSARQLGGIDLEAMREWWQLLEQSRPLVESTHALHEPALRARRDRLAPSHCPKSDLQFRRV